MKTNKRLATSTFCKYVVKQFVFVALLLAFYRLGMSYINNCTSYNNPSLMVRGSLFLIFSVLIFNPFFFFFFSWMVVSWISMFLKWARELQLNALADLLLWMWPPLVDLSGIFLPIVLKASYIFSYFLDCKWIQF